MKITIEVELDNAAFHSGPDFDDQELAEVLNQVSRLIGPTPYGKLDKEGDFGYLRDSNGNQVGNWAISANRHRR